MIAATLDSQSVWILPYFPNAQKSVRLGVTIDADVQRGLTGNSSRRPQALLLRHTLEWTAQLRAADFMALRNATLLAQDELIVVPLWMGSSSFIGGVTLAWNDGWTSWQFNPSGGAWDHTAPALVGRLSKPPALVARNDDLVTADFFFQEDSDAAYALAPQGSVLAADTTFNTISGYAAPIFPFIPDWNDQPKPGAAVVDVDRQAIGPGRQQSTAFYPQLPEQIHTATFKVSTQAQAAAFVEWYRRRAGSVGVQWVAGSQMVGRLSAPAAIGDTVLHVSPLTPLPAAGYLALFGPTGMIEIARFTSTTSTTITLASGLLNAWSTLLANFSVAMLARLTVPELSLDYVPVGLGEWSAVCTLTWREMAAEYVVPSGETRGATLGQLPAGAWFFQVDLDYNGLVQSTYLTNWESGAVAGGQTWIYNACDFDKLVQSIDLQDDGCTFTMRWYAGCPLENWLPGQLAARGYLTIFRADASSGGFSNFGQVYKLEFDTPEPEGPLFRGKCLGANALFARLAPRQLMSTTCGTNLFSARCTLPLANWIFNALIVSVSGNLVTIGTITRAIGGGLPGTFGGQDYLALGWMGWTAGGLPLRSGILTNATMSGGQLVMTMDRASTLAPGTAVTVVPGCDRLGQTCRNKYSNYTNFRGFEFMPAVSPNFIIPQQNTSPAKK